MILEWIDLKCWEEEMNSCENAYEENESQRREKS